MSSQSLGALLRGKDRTLWRDSLGSFIRDIPRYSLAVNTRAVVGQKALGGFGPFGTGSYPQCARWSTLSNGDATDSFYFVGGAYGTITLAGQTSLSWLNASYPYNTVGESISGPITPDLASITAVADAVSMASISDGYSYYFGFHEAIITGRAFVDYTSYTTAPATWTGGVNVWWSNAGTSYDFPGPLVQPNPSFGAVEAAKAAAAWTGGAAWSPDLVYPDTFCNYLRMQWKANLPAYFWYGQFSALGDGTSDRVLTRVGPSGISTPGLYYEVPHPTGTPAAGWPTQAVMVWLFLNCTPTDFLVANPTWTMR